MTESDSGEAQRPADRVQAADTDRPTRAKRSASPTTPEAAAPEPAADKPKTSPDNAASGKPRIGDSRPAPADAGNGDATSQRSGGSGAGEERPEGAGESASARRRRRRRRSNANRAEGGAEGGSNDGDRGRADAGGERSGDSRSGGSRDGANRDGGNRGGNNRSGGGDNRKGGNRNRNGGGGGGGRNKGGGSPKPVEQVVAEGPVELDESQLKRRRGRTRKGKAVGRYTMVVSRKPDATHIAILEGRHLIEYYVSRPSDDITQIHGNIYMGRVQNVLPGMEAAFVDIATPKNAVLYRADVLYDKSQFKGNERPRIEQMLKAKQNVLCQVTKNPIAHKGARLTTEVSLPGRFVVLVPNSDTYGISKRLPDPERKRLRQILDKAKPKHHGVIVRTAAENVTAEEIQRDVAGLIEQWNQIEALSKKTERPQLLYREPDLSVRVIREEFNKEYRSVIIDDRELYDEVSDYVSVITPALADRVEFYDEKEEKLSVFERFHVHEQLHKALDRKVWLPSGGSLIIEGTEALTVIDVNTGKNVGSSSLEETVFRNNLEAAEEVARQLRLRDIGGIIVIDFVDMEDRKNREETMRVFRKALARDKTRTQVFDIGELGLAEMTRKRIGEGLLESLSSRCPHCDGRGIELQDEILQGKG